MAITPQINDDLPLRSLSQAIETEITFLETSANSMSFQFGNEKYSKEEYLNGLKRFLEIITATTDNHSLIESVKSEFDFFEVYGKETWGEVFMTSYFEPVIPGSLKKTERFSTALYRTPQDLIKLDLSSFDSKFSSERKYRGRLKEDSFIPYFTREEIDSQNALSGKKLEICWVDPIDAFFLQIQGSGTIQLENGQTLLLNYADKNGHPYVPIGIYLKDQIPVEKMTLQSIETYLRTQTKDTLSSYLNRNPSYVFFRTAKDHGITTLGVPATAGRTIATDPKYFPKGALALLSFDKPQFKSSKDGTPTSIVPVTRFVLDQDTGGVITGGGRLDLFWGQGDESKQYAGIIKQTGKLYYLAPKRHPKSQ